MEWYFVAIIFLLSCFILSWLSSRLVKSLVQMARYMHWREFIIAFFVMAFITSLPNLFIDINAAWQGKPLLAFGDIVGGNLVDLTLVLAVAIFFSKKGLSAESEMVQKSAIFTAAIAVLPLLLIFDGMLSRGDGIILILVFMGYSWWLFSKKSRFAKRYHNGKDAIGGFKEFLKNLLKVIIIFILLFGASQAVISSAQFFSNTLGISLALAGVLIVALGNCFPEIYFAVISARKEENWLVLGELMGSVIICATLVLGIIGLLFPFQITDFTPFVTARIFLIAAAIFSLIFIRTNRKITKKEGMVLLFIYITFLITEIFMR